MVLSVKEKDYTKTLLPVIILFSVAIFLSDLYTPLGIADGVSYIAAIVLTIWMNSKSYTWAAAIITSFLTLLGMFLSPDAAEFSIYSTNRLLALFGIWSCTILILKFKQKDAIAAVTGERLKALFTYATEGIILLNASGKITLINPKAEEQFGYDRGELLGKPIDLALPKRFRDTQENTLNTDLPSHEAGKKETLYGRRRNGTEFPVEISEGEYSLANEFFNILFIIDITERKQQQEAIEKGHIELQKYAEELKSINQELENFAYISSHDLQEPLRKIQSFGDRLKLKEEEKLSDEGKDYIERMLNAASRMQCLINDLLSFSRLSSRAREFSAISLDKIVREVIDDLEVSIEKTGTRIELDSLPIIEADATQMRQLFQNLISNAIKFRKENEKQVISISAKTQNNNCVIITVRDNGIGFDEKYLDKMFGIFQRLHGKKYEGSGIGLATCKKIATRHSGTITARSSPANGTTFIITLPIKQEANEKNNEQVSPD